MDCRGAWENEESASEKPRKKDSKGSAALGLLEGLLVDKGASRCLPAIAPGSMGRCWRKRQRNGGRGRGRLGAGPLLHACCEETAVSVPWALKVPVDQLKGVRERERETGRERQRDRDRGRRRSGRVREGRLLAYKC